MKNIMRSHTNQTTTNKAMITFLLIALLCFLCAGLFAQDTLTYDSTIVLVDSVPDVVTTGDTLPGGLVLPVGNPFTQIDMPSLLNWEVFIYHLALIVLTYFSRFFPGINTQRLPIRTIIIAGMLAAIFIGIRAASGGAITLMSIAGYAINFLVSTHAYDKIYRELFGRTKPVTNVTPSGTTENESK